MKILYHTLNHYRKSLTSSEKAIQYLAERGITSRETIEAFQLGSAQAGLSQICTPEQLDQLKQAKLIDENRRPKFQSGIITPLFTRTGELVDFHLQTLGKSMMTKCIDDQAKGIANYKGQSEIYVTDNIIYSLQMHQASYHNVVFAPDLYAASLIKAEKATVLSFKQSNQIANTIQADEIHIGRLSGHHKTIEDSLSRVVLYKEKAKPKPITVGEPILDKVVKDLDLLGYVTQDWQKKLIYLIATSRLMDKPLSGIVVSSSGSGKSSIMNSVLDLMPSKDRLLLSRLSPMSLYHAPAGFLEGKALVIDETAGTIGAEYTLRTAMSERKLSMQRPAKAKSDDTGHKTITFRCAVLESTTNENDRNPENLSRSFIIRLDESPNATAKILEAQRLAASGKGGIRPDNIHKWHHDFQNSLESLPVNIPFASRLSFPVDRPMMRREQTKLIGLIMASAMLHQHERVIVNKVIQASPKDYKIAYDLYQPIFNEVHRETSIAATELLKTMDEGRVLEFTLRDVISWMGWSYGKSHGVIKELLQYSYIEPNHNKKGRFKKVYRVLEYHQYGRKSNALITPEELSANYQTTINELSDNCQNGEDEPKSLERVELLEAEGQLS